MKGGGESVVLRSEEAPPIVRRFGIYQGSLSGVSGGEESGERCSREKLKLKYLYFLVFSDKLSENGRIEYKQNLCLGYRP